MADILTPPLDETIEASQVRIGERPITFEEYLELPDPNHEYELINGVLTKKMSAQPDHEYLQIWLLFVLSGYASAKDMGEVLGSRTAVEIKSFSGRMPDLLFVRKERMEIVRQKGVFGAPDLVIDIASPNDRDSALRSLEADYRSIGVAEIIFIDLRESKITVLRRRNGEYEIDTILAGPLVLESLGGLTLQADWILKPPRPDRFATLTAILRA